MFIFYLYTQKAMFINNVQNAFTFQIQSSGNAFVSQFNNDYGFKRYIIS